MLVAQCSGSVCSCDSGTHCGLAHEWQLACHPSPQCNLGIAINLRVVLCVCVASDGSL